MSSRRYTIFLVAACVAVISLATAIRIYQLSPDQAPKSTPVAVLPSAVPLAPEPSFYEDQTIAKPSPAVIPASSETVPESALPVVPGRPKSDGITAKAYLVGNVQTGQIYLEHNADAVMPFASMSKLITAFVATDELKTNPTIEITPEEAQAPPDGSGIAAGERYTMQELLLPMLLDSSNIAAEAIASSTNRKHFLEQMSSYAWEVGMPSTYFADPSGVSPENISSAKDLFGLAQYLYKYRPDILAITRTAHTAFATTTDHGSHLIDSIHPFVTDPRFIGGKTGRTPEAGETMMTIMRIGFQPVAFIILGSQEGRRQQDTQLLIDKLGSVTE